MKLHMHRHTVIFSTDLFGMPLKKAMNFGKETEKRYKKQNLLFIKKTIKENKMLKG